jgi:hypothetical protein
MAAGEMLPRCGKQLKSVQFFDIVLVYIKIPYPEKELVESLR